MGYHGVALGVCVCLFMLPLLRIDACVSGLRRAFYASRTWGLIYLTIYPLPICFLPDNRKKGVFHARDLYFYIWEFYVRFLRL